MKPKHLTQAETNRLLSYVSEVKSLMSLNDTQVMLMLTTPHENGDADSEEDVWASMAWNEMKRLGQLRVCKQWSTLNERIKTDCVVHELLHLLLRDVDDMLDHAVGLMGLREGGLWRQVYNRQSEMAVNQLTKLLVRHVPQWPGSPDFTFPYDDDVYVEDH